MLLRGYAVKGLLDGRPPIHRSRGELDFPASGFCQPMHGPTASVTIRPMENRTDAPRMFLRPKEAAEFLGISKAWLYELEKKNPTFPRRRRLSENVTGWLADELAAWARGLPSAREENP